MRISDWISDVCSSDLIDNDADLQPVVDRWTQLYAATDEKHDPVRFEKEVPEEKRVSARGIEVGHIFFFGDKYSKPMGALVSTSGGQEVPVQMGSYGIGVSRLVGAILEARQDANGIVLPEPVAPVQDGLANIRPGCAHCEIPSAAT